MTSASSDPTPESPSDPDAGPAEGAVKRAARALGAILSQEKETGELRVEAERSRLDPAARVALEEMLKDVHRLRRHRDSIGAPAAAGDWLGRYKLLELVGRGGTSTVWLASDESLDRRVALKILAPPLGMSETQTLRFKREAQVAGSISHPSVLSVLDVGFDRGLHFLVAEYIQDGKTLADLLTEQRTALPRLPFRTAARLLLQVCEGLSQLHERGIIHRDLKPANILMRPSGELVLGDLGLARVGQKDDQQTTRSGAGTPFYRSPEQVRESDDLDVRSDVFSFGVTMYELLVGRRPFEGSSTQSVNDNILHQQPVELRKLLPDLPRDLETICLHALEKDPARRYAGAAAMGDDLKHYLAHRTIEARPASAVQRSIKLVRRHPVFSTALSALILLSGVTNAYWLAERDRKAEIAVSDEALRQSKLALDQTLNTAEEALRLLTPGGGTDREETLRLVELMAESARAETAFRSSRQALSAGEFAMKFGHVLAAVGILKDSVARAEEAVELGDPGSSSLLIRSRLAHLRALRHAYQRPEAVRIARAYLDQPVGEETPLEEARFLLEALNAHAALQQAAQIEEVEAEYRGVLKRAETLLKAPSKEEPGASTSDRLALAQSFTSYLDHCHRYSEALTLIDETFDELRNRHGLYDHRTLAAGLQLARTLNWSFVYGMHDTKWTRLKLGELLWPAAVQTLGEGARVTIFCRWVLGESLLHASHHEEALTHYQAVRRDLGRWEPPSSRAMRSLSVALAVALKSAGRLAEAEELFREMIPILAEQLGPEHHDAIIPRRGLAETLNTLGRHEEAQVEWQWQMDALLKQRDALGAGPALTTVSALQYTHILQGHVREVAGLQPQILELIESEPDLQEHWRSLLTSPVVEEAECVRMVLAGDREGTLTSATTLLELGLQMPPPAGDRWIFVATAARLIYGEGAPALPRDRTPRLLTWATDRQRGDFSQAASYAAEHSEAIKREIRDNAKAVGYPGWIVIQALKAAQVTDKAAPRSPVEASLLEHVRELR
ncbi:MAG: serine/threonine-protein kinase [Planctomycetota bacterium]|nr:serine/threonine-protein kinase [Planctomycetota bacterium]